METDNPFEKVLDRLREKGWTRYTLGTASGPHCIRGAAYYELGGWSKMCKGLAPILAEHYPYFTKEYYGDSYSCNVMAFNDCHSTTFTDVERVLEKAAVKWEEERVMRDE